MQRTMVTWQRSFMKQIILNIFNKCPTRNEHFSAEKRKKVTPLPAFLVEFIISKYRKLVRKFRIFLTNIKDHYNTSVKIMFVNIK